MQLCVVLHVILTLLSLSAVITEDLDLKPGDHPLFDSSFEEYDVTPQRKLFLPQYDVEKISAPSSDVEKISAPSSDVEKISAPSSDAEKISAPSSDAGKISAPSSDVVKVSESPDSHASTTTDAISTWTPEIQSFDKRSQSDSVNTRKVFGPAKSRAATKTHAAPKTHAATKTHAAPKTRVAPKPRLSKSTIATRRSLRLSNMSGDSRSLSTDTTQSIASSTLDSNRFCGRW